MPEVLCGPLQAENWLGISVQCVGFCIRKSGEPSPVDSALFLQKSQVDSRVLGDLFVAVLLCAVSTQSAVGVLLDFPILD